MRNEVISSETYKQYKGIVLKEFLTLHGINPEKKFKCLNHKHEDKHPSMSYFNNRVYYFGCKARYDLIGAIMVLERKGEYASICRAYRLVNAYLKIGK